MLIMPGRKPVMIKAYINYPNPHIMAHFEPDCSNIQKQQKPRQRTVRIDIATISKELGKFRGRAYRFAATSEQNDMWLEIDFSDADFEWAVLGCVHRLLSKHYTPFGKVSPMRHCSI
jgi:hypothetical protein